MVLPHHLIHSSQHFGLACLPYIPHVSFMSPRPLTHREVLLMDSFINGGSQEHRGGATQELVCRNQLQQGIIFVLSRWYALQMAIKNHWGGSDSLHKSHHLAADIFSLLSKSNAPVPVDDLENLLHESMLLTFNTEIEDGSIEEVAEQLVAIHEEYLLHQSS